MAHVKRMRILRVVCVLAILLGLVAGTLVMLRRNLGVISSDVIAAMLSRALRIGDVHIENVAIHGVRSVVISGLQIGNALSAERVLVAYDVRSLLRARGNPMLSVTAIDAEGVWADWAVLQGCFGVGGAHTQSPTAGRLSAPSLRPGPAPAGVSGLRGGEAASGVFRGVVSIRDAVVLIGRPAGSQGGPDAEHGDEQRRIELADVRLEPVASARIATGANVNTEAVTGEGAGANAGTRTDTDTDTDMDAGSGLSETSWSLAVDRAVCYWDHRPSGSVELLHVRGALDVSSGAAAVRDFSARVLGGVVRGDFAVRPALLSKTGVAETSIEGRAALSGLSYNGWTVDGELATCDDGKVRVDARVESSEPGLVKARLQGAVAVLGFTPCVDDYSADGIVDIEKMEIGKSSVRNMRFKVTARWSPGADAVAVTIGAKRTTTDQLAAVIGRFVPAQGWVRWRAAGEVGFDGHACARITLVDGAVRADGWPDEWPSEFTGISGIIDAEADVWGHAGGMVQGGTGPEVRLRVAEVSAQFGGGLIEVSGRPELWNVSASGIRIHHQLVSGLVDADLRVGIGKLYSLSGRVSVRDAQMDLVVAGIQNGIPVPEADLDLDIEVGEGVKMVRGESWAWALPGVLHVKGSTRRPVVSGSLSLSSGQIDLYGVPLEIVSGGVRFTGTPGDPPEFDLTARDVASELPTIIAVSGVPGKMRLTAKLEDQSEKETLEGDLLVKLLLARLRLYMLGRLGRALGEFPNPPG